MGRLDDDLRATLDLMDLPKGASHADREYLISMLSRLGYTEREIEVALGIHLEQKDPHTIELEYSERRPQ